MTDASIDSSARRDAQSQESRVRAPLLEFRDLSITYKRRGTSAPIVENLNLAVAHGESIGIVGESGSGKSMTVKAAMRLLPKGVAASGQILSEGRSVLDLGRRDLAAYRAKEVALIHQDPRAHTNPMRTVGDFLVEAVVATGEMSRAEASARACDLLREVGVPDPERRLRQYPHQLSGGLLQRMMIVMALLPSPKLVFADEPTTALDVTVQSEVMAILQEQIAERGVGLVFISHDLDLAAAVTDKLAVMYAGSIVETGATATVYARPLHPYTAGLLGCRPSPTKKKRLLSIPGRPTSASEAGAGCVFAARCQFATDRCRAERPETRRIDDRDVACHRVEEISHQLPTVASA